MTHSLRRCDSAFFYKMENDKWSYHLLSSIWIWYLLFSFSLKLCTTILDWMVCLVQSIENSDDYSYFLSKWICKDLLNLSTTCICWAEIFCDLFSNCSNWRILSSDVTVLFTWNGKIYNFIQDIEATFPFSLKLYAAILDQMRCLVKSMKNNSYRYNYSWLSNVQIDM